MKLLRNLLYLSVGEVVSKVATFAAVAYLARVAGPVGYGYIEFAGAVLLCAGLIVDQGFGAYGAREIAKEPQRTAELVTEIVVARFILAGVAYAAVIAFALLLNRSAIITQLLLIYGLSLLATPLLLQWVFQGNNHMQTVAILQLIRQTIYAAVIFAFVRTESQIWIAAVAEIAGVVSAAIYGVWMYRRQFDNAVRLRLTLSRQLFREGVPIGLSQIFWMMRMFGATVIVGLIASAQDVGFFGGAMRILIALHAFIWLYFFNLLPSLSKAWQKREETFHTLLDRSMHSVVWLSILGGSVWVLLAPAVMAGVYGAAFAPAGVVLQWLAGVAIAAALSGHYRYGLIAAGEQTIEMLISALGALFAVILIPVGYAIAGTSGAAIGLFAAEVVVWWSAWWWAGQRLGTSGHAKLFIRPLVATGLMLGLLWMLPSASLGVQIVIVIATIVVQSLMFDRVVRERLRELASAWHLRVGVQHDKRAQAARKVTY